ncbi:unnamed protein product [Sphenostylis stenocarpa]|uniref:Cytochrome P450 n=1 Tax=Sphenostylis stenocarpa TaxID=92480 RepID=A0AA86SKW7_9FABA|nr:unnamed protein product [Sphenostylis stenocarpa]
MCAVSAIANPMDSITLFQLVQTHSFATSLAVAALSLLFLFWLLRRIPGFTRRHAGLPPVPAVPGLPVIGNLLQLKEKKPYKTFTRMAQKHGPIYSIRTGASTIIVLNSADLAKEVGHCFSF